MTTKKAVVKKPKERWGWQVSGNDYIDVLFPSYEAAVKSAKEVIANDPEFYIGDSTKGKVEVNFFQLIKTIEFTVVRELTEKVVKQYTARVDFN